MILDFSKIEETVIPQFYGGEKEIKAHMSIDKNNKILCANPFNSRTNYIKK